MVKVEDLDIEIGTLQGFGIALWEAGAFPDPELLAYEDRFNTQQGLCIYCGCEEEPSELQEDDWLDGWCNC